MAGFESCYGELIQDITNFYQQDDESFLQCWERFKCSIFSWSRFIYELGDLLVIFCRGLNPTTCQFDLLSDEEFLSKTPEESWDYLEELGQKPQFCELTEIEIEPLVRNDPLENSLTIEEIDAEMYYLISLFPVEDVHNGESLYPTSEAVPPIAFLSTLPSSIPIESPPQEHEKVEIIDFLGVDNHDCVYNPFLVNLVNTLKMNLVRIMHFVELDFLKRLLLSLYSKYLIVWHGRVQFLIEGLKWNDMLVLLALRSTMDTWISCEGSA